MADKYQKWFKYVFEYGEYDPIRSGSIDGIDKEPHDRAITRALKSEYVPDKNLKGNPRNTLFVGRLHTNTDEEKLYNEFSRFGKIKSCIVVRDTFTGKSKRYAFIEFEEFCSAKEAHKKMHLKIIDQSEIIIEYEYGRTLNGWKPRRLGGGLGGRKESGQLRFGGRIRPFQKPFKYAPTNFNELNRLLKSTSKRKLN